MVRERSGAQRSAARRSGTAAGRNGSHRCRARIGPGSVPLRRRSEGIAPSAAPDRGAGRRIAAEVAGLEGSSPPSSRPRWRYGGREHAQLVNPCWSPRAPWVGRSGRCDECATGDRRIPATVRKMIKEGRLEAIKIGVRRRHRRRDRQRARRPSWWLLVRQLLDPAQGTPQCLRVDPGAAQCQRHLELDGIRYHLQ